LLRNNHFGRKSFLLAHGFGPGLGGAFCSKIGLIGSIPMEVSIDSSAKFRGDFGGTILKNFNL
jgi:hypothetical protein